MSSIAASKRAALRYRIEPEVVDGKPVVAFGMAKRGGPVQVFTFAGDVGLIEGLAADLMRAASAARLMALMESRNKERRGAGR